MKLDIPDYQEKMKLSVPELYKREIQTNFLFLCKDILGYRYDPVQRVGILGTDPIHVEFLKTLKDPHRFKLMEYFRGSYKTTLMANKCVEILINDPEATILLVTESWGYARKILRQVKRHLVNNFTLTQYFGNFIPTPQQKKDYGYVWSRDAIDIRQRKVELFDKQPSIMTAGVDSEVTGQHPTWAILDDVVGPKNITTSDQKWKVIDYINQLIPLLGSSGKLILVGTPWAFDDAYEYVRKNWLDKSDSNGMSLFQFSRMGIWDDDQNPTMGSVYDRDRILQLRSVTPTFSWYSQYECNPCAIGNSLISPRDIENYQKLPVGDYDVYITVDPAISLDPRKCWTGIIAAVPVRPNFLYIDEAKRLKVLPHQLIEELMLLLDQYQGRVRAVGIEETSFQKIYAGSLINEIRKKMSQNPSYNNVNVIGMPARGSKSKRIEALEPYFRYHQIKIREGLHFLEDQILQYPNIGENNRDLIDSLGYQLTLLPATCLQDPYGIIVPEDRVDKRKPGGLYDDGVMLNRSQEVMCW